MKKQKLIDDEEDTFVFFNDLFNVTMDEDNVAVGEDDIKMDEEQ